MYSVSAINRTTALLSAILLMASLWGVGRLPGANLQMIVFTFLSSAFLMDFHPFSDRLRLSTILACNASAAQFLLSITADLPFLRIITVMGSVFWVFRTLPDYHTGCIVMITGCLSSFAPSGFMPAISRSIDIFAGVPVIMAVTTFFKTEKQKNRSTPVMRKFSSAQAMRLSAELTTGALLAQLLQLKQGAWVMLTILFIIMSETPDMPKDRLVFQRIFAVPIGILIGDLLLETFFRMDYHLFYLIPFIGAAGFFILYSSGNFFLFSVVFMISMTLFSDWMNGPHQQFNFREDFVSRSAATLTGALIELFLHVDQTTEKQDQT